MNQREKILAILVGAGVLVGMVYLIAFQVYITPSRALDARIAELTEKANKLYEENQTESKQTARLKALAARTYDVDELKASELARARLTELLGRAGLANDALSLKPVGGVRVAGAYKEVGWSIHARGRLANIIDFLYLVGADPRLSRLDMLNITPAAKGGDVDLQVRYASLILEAPKGGKPPAAGVEPLPLLPPTLDAPEHKLYQIVSVRDVLRPYLPRPVSPAEGAAAVAESSDPPPPDSPDARLRVVGLPTFATRQDVFIRDLSAQTVTSYKPGDELIGGRIVMVDYRSMPLPNKPFISSGSRVILELDNEYWAVELGQSLAERYKMAPDQLPAGLKPRSQGAKPADKPTVTAAAGGPRGG